MELHELTAIAPIDGRYGKKSKDLRNYFSEYALMKYRLWVEVEYFTCLCELPLPQLIKVPKKQLRAVRDLPKQFDLDAAKRVKEIEKETNHDVKAIEYYLKEKMVELELSDFTEFVHFGLTSQDINNTAQPAMLKDFMEKVYEPFIEEELFNELKTISVEWKNIPMLAHTHGQPATPTTIGREIMVFYERLIHQVKMLKQVPHTCKFGGATGSLNAHYATYGAINWHAFADEFTLKKLGLERQKITTQIEHYDYMAALFDNLRRINNILIDMCRDMWTYISMEYFNQRIKKNEVGSSTMPHKVNPIDFENAEGNFMLSNSLLEFLANKLPISRMQRDLTDSTVGRNIGLALSHTMLAMRSLMQGLDKISVNREKLNADLEANFMVITEAMQSILRREGYPQPYEALKTISRSRKKLGKEDLQRFIEELDVKDYVKEELRELTPQAYLGVSNELTQIK